LNVVLFVSKVKEKANASVYPHIGLFFSLLK